MAKKTLVARLGLVFFAFTLASCAVSLGKFDNKSGDYSSYYDAFGEVKGLYDGGEVSYDIKKSLFNDKALQDFSWEKEEDEVKDLPYLYIVLPFKEAMKVSSVAFYLRSNVNITLEMSLFYFMGEGDAPQEIKYLSSPDTRPIYNEDDEQIGEEVIEYDDPPISQAMIHGEIELARESWTSLVFGNFSQEGYEDNFLHTGKDSLLYIRIENNSGFNASRLQSASFSFINLLVRAE